MSALMFLAGAVFGACVSFVITGCIVSGSRDGREPREHDPVFEAPEED